jgi:hypothetical protein
MKVIQMKQPRPEEGATVGDWARAYASLGWHVFPVLHDKRPATSRGWHDATTDVSRFNWANKGIGVATKPSGLLCVDVDIKHRADGTFKDGLRWLEAMEAEYGELPRNVEARTPSGGQHIILRAPPGAPIQLVAGNGFPDVDLIGAGYFVVEPSVCGGGDYFWIDDASPFEDDPADTPTWLARLIETYTRERPSKVANRGPERFTKADELASDSDEVAVLESALSTLDPSMGRSPWLQVGMAIHAKSGGSAFGFNIWDEWSRASPKYDSTAIRRDWMSFDPWGGTTLGTVFALAEAEGWRRESFELEQMVEQAAKENPEWLDLYHRAVEALGEYGPERSSLLPQEVGNGAALLSKDFPPTDWLIQGLLTEQAVFVIGGEPKTSKTWAGLEVLISCLTGLRCFGELPVKRVDRPVFAFLAEDQERSLRNRLRSLAHGKGCDPRPWAGRFLYQTLKALDLSSLESTAALLADIWLAAPGGISVLYLDPLRDVHSAEENDSGGMKEVMGRLRALRNVLGCAVVFAHHSHKASQGTSGRRAGQGLRGSSAVHGAVDGGLYLGGLRKNADETELENAATVELKALRGCGSFTLTLELDDDGNGEATRAAWDFSRKQRAAADESELKVTAAIAWLRMREDADDGFGPTDVSRRAGVSKSTAAKYLKQMVAAGQLTVTDRGRYRAGDRWEDR